MDLVLFLIFAIIAVVGAVNVVVQTHPISSAVSLIGVMGSLAILYLLLGAEFIAAAQVIVYAGAVMVLFLFVIMLLDLKTEERRRLKGVMAKLLFVIGLGAVSAITAAFFKSLSASGLKTQPESTLDGTTFDLGKLLFTNYLLPFEIVSILLLVAIVGVILLSKRDLK